MANLRKWLDDEGFDWGTGRILWQKVASGAPGWSSPVGAKIIDFTDKILDHEFDDGFGSPECPRIIAEDFGAIYFPSQYDGATRLEKIYKDISLYLDYKNNETPYPG
jgi:hypothetical protein